jgi:hypothetical protein
MNDSEHNLDHVQSTIRDSVAEKHEVAVKSLEIVNVCPEEIRNLISSMKRGVSPGHDNICVEHLIYGTSDILCTVLADLYASVLSTASIPESLLTGVIVPIIKKPTLDSNSAENFRPITLSTTFSRLLELLISPDYTPSDTQFGFRQGRGTSFVNCMINDITSCTLDAEKCFDSIWHNGLFYKLWDKIPTQHWTLLLNWYRSTRAVVRWNGTLSYFFNISRGMKQGSLLSPTLFNVFLDDLLVELKNTDAGIRIDDMFLNSCAYADDVTVFSASIPGLQLLMNVSSSYAKKWRFSFSTRKTKCIILGKQLTKSTPVWFLNGQEINISEEVDILGVALSTNRKASSHLEKRISACRKAIYSFSSAGMAYPGLHAEAKTYIWKTIGVPTLTYGMETLSLSANDIKRLSSVSATTLKSVFGLSKRSHHTDFLGALKITPIGDEIRQLSASLWHRIFMVDSPVRELQARVLSKFLLTGTCVNGTLLSSLINSGLNPINIIITKPVCNYNLYSDGVVDSLRYLLYHENFVKPWSDQFILATMLTKSF